MTNGDKFSLRCPVCSTVYASAKNNFTCEPCGAPTVVEMNISEATPFVESETNSLWRYFNLLPISDRSCIVSQGEGQTPLIQAERFADFLGVNTLLLKNETTNPTGAFKDRQISVGISQAREIGADTIAVVSSGNVAASAASYSALTNMKCRVFTPANAPDDRLIQAQVYGAEFLKVNTLSSSLIFKLVNQACQEKNWHLLSTAGLYNPFQVEGAKTIAHELFEQTDALPDWIIAPVGGGGLLGALWRGFKELVVMGKIEKIPRLVGVQSSACTPLVQALEGGLSPKQVIENPVEVGETIAGAIADDILFDAYTVLPAIRQTGGMALDVTDQQMLAAQKLLARQAGLFAEPTSAATIAALQKMLAEKRISQNDNVCCIITGSGFKDLGSAKQIVASPVHLEPTIEAFLALN